MGDIKASLAWQRFLWTDKRQCRLNSLWFFYTLLWKGKVNIDIKIQGRVLMSKPRILILCTGNSCRSHIAEGLLRQMAADLFEVHSAGSNPAGYVHPKAVLALAEIGIDISHHTSKHMDTFRDREIHIVITVCGHADRACPTFPGQLNRYHWSFEDPAKATGSEEEIMAVFRRVREAIRLVFGAWVAGYREGMALPGGRRSALDI